MERSALLVAVVFALSAASARATSVPTLAEGQSRAARAETAASAATVIYTRTEEVLDLALAPGRLYAATRGGVEEYALPGYDFVRVYTTADGLAENLVASLTVAGEALSARTARAVCTLQRPGRLERDANTGSPFSCAPAPPLPAAAPAPAPQFHGARITRTLAVDGATLIATDGAGLWVVGAGGHAGHGTPKGHDEAISPRRLTRDHQICSNHVSALATFAGRTWFGSFDEGLCSLDEAGFRTMEVPFRMVNDLLVVRGALYIAASEGLFRTVDGLSVERVPTDGVTRGFNHLAARGRRLWATTPGALVRIDGPRVRVLFQPGGSRALQSVSVEGDVVWLASEDRGAIRIAGSGSRGEVTVFDRAAGLPTSWLVDIAADGAGGAWLASLRHGLIHLHGDGSSDSIAGLPDGWLLSVQRERAGKGLWVGTQGGAAVVDEAGRVRALHRHGDARPAVHDVLATDSRLWFATEAGVERRRR